MKKIFFTALCGLIIGLGLFYFLKPMAQTTVKEQIQQDTDLAEISHQELINLAQELQEFSLEQAAQVKAAPFADPELLASVAEKFQQFSKLAEGDATKIDNNNGQLDLACIFRGMAIDAQTKLAALQTSKTVAEQAALWREAAELFGDVELVITPKHDLPVWSGETCDIGES